VTHPWQVTPTFRKRLQAKKPEEQARVLRCVEKLVTDHRHPGLHTHPVQGHRGVFEARIDKALRLTFHWDGSVIVLRNNCRHDETLARP